MIIDIDVHVYKTSATWLTYHFNLVTLVAQRLNICDFDGICLSLGPMLFAESSWGQNMLQTGFCLWHDLELNTRQWREGVMHPMNLFSLAAEPLSGSEFFVCRFLAWLMNEILYPLIVEIGSVSSCSTPLLHFCTQKSFQRRQYFAITRLVNWSSFGVFVQLSWYTFDFSW